MTVGTQILTGKPDVTKCDTIQEIVGFLNLWCMKWGEKIGLLQKFQIVTDFKSSSEKVKPTCEIMWFITFWMKHAYGWTFL